MSQSRRDALKLSLSMGAVGLLIAMIFSAPYFAGRVAYAITAAQNSADRERLVDMAKNDTISPLYRQVAKVVMPAVVEVRVTKSVSVSPSPDMDEFFRRYFNDQTPGARPRARQPQQREMRGLGSGVIVDAKNGYVITNSHVVGGADRVEIVMADNKKYPAEWVRTDPASDIAVVKIKGNNLIAAPLGDSSVLEVGDMVVAVGSPEGLPQTMTSGIISAKGRTQMELGVSTTNLYQNFLQTDAAINHGNSGGPLVNMRGEVIGINTAIISRTGVNEGIGLAIPSSMVKEVMMQLIDKGKVTRGYVGVVLQEVDENLAKSFNLPDTAGALVTDVAADGPAAKAGLKAGDFIVGVDGKKASDVNSLRHMVAAIAPGTKVKLDVIREGKKQPIEVTIGEQPKDMAAALRGTGPVEPGEGEKTNLGIKVDELTPELMQQLGYRKSVRGVVITEVTPGSSAADQGLAAGMVITQVQDKMVSTPAEFAKAIAGKAQGVRMRVTDPNGNGRFVFIEPYKERPSLNGKDKAPAAPEENGEE